MKKHIVSSYDWELKRLNSTVTDMGYLAIEQIEASIDAMRKGDSKKAKQIVLDDQKIDNLEHEVANLSLRLLALRQPMALDLRNIVASLKISSDIERIADYASNIAERSPLLSSSKPIQLLTPSIIELGNLVSKMFKNIVEAYAKQDSLKAMQIWKSDVKVDKMYNKIMKNIISSMIKHQKSLNSHTHLLFMAKTLERLGDHSTNIAEDIYFLVNGKQYKKARPKG